MYSINSWIESLQTQSKVAVLSVLGGKSWIQQSWIVMHSIVLNLYLKNQESVPVVLNIEMLSK